MIPVFSIIHRTLFNIENFLPQLGLGRPPSLVDAVGDIFLVFHGKLAALFIFVAPFFELSGIKPTLFV
jgi:hypothetical protein